MIIPIHQWLCGNCLLLSGGRCSVDSSPRSSSDSYCIHLFANFTDRGYKKPEVPPIYVDYKEIDEECKKFSELMEKFRAEREGGNREEEIEQSHFPF